MMLNLVARTPDKRTVLLLQWQRGRVLALHEDGELVEYRLAEVKVDRLEAVSRIAINEEQNRELIEQAASS